MVKALILLTPGYEPVEAIGPADVLGFAGVEVIFAAVGTPTLEVESNGVTIKANTMFDDVADSLYDAIIVPGGWPGAPNLAKQPKVIQAIKHHFENNKIVAAICASPCLVLSEACQIVKGRKACGHPSFDEKIEQNGGIRVEDRVCVDGNLVTSRGPGTALLFGLELAKILVSKEKADWLQEGMLIQ